MKNLLLLCVLILGMSACVSEDQSEAVVLDDQSLIEAEGYHIIDFLNTDKNGTDFYVVTGSGPALEVAFVVDGYVRSIDHSISSMKANCNYCYTICEFDPNGMGIDGGDDRPGGCTTCRDYSMYDGEEIQDSMTTTCDVGITEP